jgi:hypothetical protein
MNERFVGRWLLVSDAEVRTAAFTSEGDMTYVITFEGRELQLPLRYRVEGESIVTLADGTEEEVRAGFVFEDRDTLVLDYSGEKFTFRRAPG